MHFRYIFALLITIAFTGCDNQKLYEYKDIKNCVLEKFTPRFMLYNMHELSFKKDKIEYSFIEDSNKKIKISLPECEGISFYRNSFFFYREINIDIPEQIVLINGKDETVKIIHKCFNSGLNEIKNSNTEQYSKLEKLSEPLKAPCSNNNFLSQCK